MLARVQQLRAVLVTAGSVPNNGLTGIAAQNPASALPATDSVIAPNATRGIEQSKNPILPVVAVPGFDIPLDSTLLPNETPFSLEDNAYNTYNSTIPTFDMFFNLDLDMDGEHDADFLPTSSPKHISSGESSEDMAVSTSNHRKRKHRVSRRKARKQRRVEEEEDEEFIDPEVEDEDLFLPIEDVPIPGNLKQDAMRSLGVDNQGQLVKLINKMLNVGQEGMTPETVEKLKVLLTLVGPQGGWSGQANAR